MSQNNAYIYETDGFRTKLYSQDETVEMFGSEFLADYGHVVPEELLSRYQQNEAERQAIASELNKIKESTR